MIFKREKTEKDILMGKVYNNFYKTGFMNESVYTSKDRDIWTHMKTMLSDTNTASVFENILVAYEELDYSEAILQQLVSREFKDNKIHDSIKEVYATTNPINVRFVRCLFTQNPSNYRNDKLLEIVNTLKILKEKYSHMTMCDNVIKYLENQLTIHSESKSKDVTKHLLHEDNIVTLVIPILEDNMYYNTNGIARYPYMTEMYHHIKTAIGQISFIFKSKVVEMNENSKKYKYVKRQSFFDVGEYTTLHGELLNIFYVKLFSKFYNPLMFFEMDDVNKLLFEMEEDPNVTPYVKEILSNTYKCYVDELEVVRKTYGNLVPTIVITKEDDSYYDNIRESLEKLKEMQEEELEALREDSISEDCTVDSDDDIDETDDEINASSDQYSSEIEKLEEILRKRDDYMNEKHSRASSIGKLARNALSMSKLKGLIMGYNGVKIFGYYPHLSDVMLKYTDLNDVKVSSGVVENPKQFPKSFQIISTISNDEMFCTNDSFNPIDWLFPFMYRKTLVHSVKENGVTTSKDMNVAKEERYLTEDEMGIIDPHTKKSDTAAGLLASINPFITVKSRVEVGNK